MTDPQFLLTDRHGGWWQVTFMTNPTLLEMGDRVDHALIEEATNPTEVIFGRALEARCNAILDGRGAA